jgi:regulatory protein
MLGTEDPEAKFGTDERLQHALELAYAYLNRRDRTVAEVLGHLQRHGIEEETRQVVIRTLSEQRFLDDHRYAHLFAQDKRELEQWGSERIRRGLGERGIAPELIEEALAAGSHETELDRALELLRRRFPAPPRDRRERDRALGVMLRKGYETEVALDALTAYARDSER